MWNVLNIGDRVAVPWLGSACGVRDDRADGWETLCEKQVNTGYSVNGAYAEYVVAYAAYVAQVPDTIDPLDASVLTCAGVTTYKAVKVSGARPGQLWRCSASAGLAIWQCNTERSAAPPWWLLTSWTTSSSLPRNWAPTMSSMLSTEDPVEMIQALGGAHAAISVAVSLPKAFEQAFGALRRGGTLVFVALPADNFVKLPIFETVLRGITIVGSIVEPARTLPRWSRTTLKDGPG